MEKQDLTAEILDELPVKLMPDYPLDFLAELEGVERHVKTQYDIYYIAGKEKFLLTLIRKTEICKHVGDLSSCLKFETTEFYCYIYKMA